MHWVRHWQLPFPSFSTFVYCQASYAVIALEWEAIVTLLISCESRAEQQQEHEDRTSELIERTHLYSVEN
ncbi:hypothetical protein OUZ56_020615 [Daphnia magna]|uniref:Secreted protein n=1 Tax=Daphnia magna TaxID=35525 RepID=A0ABQ9ZFP3_9CRUS|nr:hypothetical protein OUZ56_020615 [Daphnia magna]